MLFKLIFFTLTSLCVGTLGQITTDLWLLGNYNNSVEGTLISSGLLTVQRTALIALYLRISL
ncbi:hypothetical protein HI914_07050 [Erysiphe necator]|nr:hypothetical protein HI914_07050 [Erysiphe necator]